MEESERLKQAVTGTASAIQKEIAGTGGEQPTEGRADRILVGGGSSILCRDSSRLHDDEEIRSLYREVALRGADR